MTLRVLGVRLSCFRVECLESRLMLLAGGFDPSFAGDGLTGTNFGRGVTADSGAAAVQPDGKTVVVAEISGGKFGVARFNVNGTPDLTFGPARTGTIETSFPTSSRSRALALQPDGKIVVVGDALRDNGTSNPPPGFAVARYHADGTLDQTFDDGLKTFDFGPDDVASAATSVVVQGDGRIVIGGTVEFDYSAGEVELLDSDFAFARLNPDGSFDRSFDGDGRQTLGFGDLNTLSEIAVDETGTPATNPNYRKLLAVGTRRTQGPSAWDDAVVGRLNADGTADFSFDNDGRLVIPALRAAAALLVQPTGRIVVVGTTRGDVHPDGWVSTGLAMLRLMPTGETDATFYVTENTDGFSHDTATDVISTYDGGLILSGVSRSDPTSAYPSGYYSNHFFAYSADGVPDTRYGHLGGWSGTTPIPDGHMITPYLGPGKMAAGPGRRYVYAGTYGRVARFLGADANLVRMTALLDPHAAEAGQDPASFFIFRSERLPYAQGVFFTAGGTATAPLPTMFPRPGRRSDYSGVSEPPVSPVVYFDTGYAVIPANETYTVVTITPHDDAMAEGDEFAVFTLQPHASYEIGDPQSVSLVIRDNDAVLTSAIAGRHAFYNRSAFDGNDPEATGADDAAVAADKVALLPGQASTAANYTGYTRGLNGVMVDIAGVPAGAAPFAADFAFKIGNNGDPSTWVDGPAPVSVTLRRGAGVGGSDRVTLVWPDGAIFNQWLQVTVRSTVRTGLPRPDVFYFGNLAGDTGDGSLLPQVGPLDLARVRRSMTASATVTTAADVNRDGRVSPMDLAATRASLQSALPRLASPAASASATAMPAPPPAPAAPGPPPVTVRTQPQFTASAPLRDDTPPAFLLKEQQGSWFW